jgi:hypothetical protein
MVAQVGQIYPDEWSEPLQTGPFGRTELSRVLGELRFKFVRRSVAKR